MFGISTEFFSGSYTGSGGIGMGGMAAFCVISSDRRRVDNGKVFKPGPGAWVAGVDWFRLEKLLRRSCLR
jgi:hypothetical protein